MRILTTIIAILGLIITLAFTITPIGYITVFPGVTTIICGFILLKTSKENRKKLFPKIIIVIASIAVLLSVGRNLLNNDEVVKDENFEHRQSKSSNDALKDLEEL